MKEGAKQPAEKTEARTSSAEMQASMGQILQAYRPASPNNTGEKPIPVQLKPAPVIQKISHEEAPKLEAAYKAAMETGAFSNEVYHQTLKGYGYPYEDDASDESDDPVQLKGAVVQLARSPYAISGPKDYGGLTNVLYQCDDKGNIDFGSPSQHYIGNAYPGLNPIKPLSDVDVSDAVRDYGKGDRYRHFKEANGKKPLFGGVNGSSPDNLTWHHLTAKHQMHLVERLVHSKHGHNGGVHLW